MLYCGYFWRRRYFLVIVFEFFGFRYFRYDSCGFVRLLLDIYYIVSLRFVAKCNLINVVGFWVLLVGSLFIWFKGCEFGLSWF